MTDPPAPSFTIVGTPQESAMPDGENVLLRWSLSGIPDGQWEADFAGRTAGDAGITGAFVVAANSSRGHVSEPTVNGSNIIWVVPRGQIEQAKLFVEQRLGHANQLLRNRKLELG
jgi:hypothetical protein